MPLSIEIIEEALSKRGYDFNRIRLCNKKSFTQIKKDGRVLLTIARGYPLYPFATSSAQLIAHDKNLAYDFVRSKGITAPRTVVIEKSDKEENDEAQELLEEFGCLVVKPLDAAGGKGLTLDVTTTEGLSSAISRARQASPIVLVQRQFFGEEFRFTIVNGKAVSVLMRQKPQVVGDGRTPLGELIRQENEDRKKITDTLVPYPQLDGLIDSRLLASEEVLDVGEVCELSKSTMIKGGASVFNVTDQIHGDYIALAERAAQDLGKGFITVDMMIKNWRASLANDAYVFIEFNLSPALALFYSCRDGRHVRVVEDYLVPMLVEVME